MAKAQPLKGKGWSWSTIRQNLSAEAYLMRVKEDLVAGCQHCREAVELQGRMDCLSFTFAGLTAASTVQLR